MLCTRFLVYLRNCLCKDFYKETAAWSWQCIISDRFCKLAVWEVKTRLARCPAVHHVLSGATGSIEPVSTQLSFLASGGGGGVENLISGISTAPDKGSSFLKCSPCIWALPIYLLTPPPLYQTGTVGHFFVSKFFLADGGHHIRAKNSWAWPIYTDHVSKRGFP